MSLNEEETGPTKTPVNDTHKQLVFSFIHTIRSLEADKRKVDAAVANLVEAFGVDPAGVAGVHDAGVDLVKVFEEAVVQSK